MSEKMRWFKFWPADWQSDEGLRQCSLAARGLWIECIGLMHRATPYGHLVIRGRVPTARQLAAIVSAPEREVEKLLAELEGAGVFERTEDGAIYSRRMVRDAAKSEEGRKAVAKRKDRDGPARPPGRSPIRSPDRDPTRGVQADLQGHLEGTLQGGLQGPLAVLEAEAEEEEERTSLRSVAKKAASRDLTPGGTASLAVPPDAAGRGARLPDGWQPGPELCAFARNLDLDPPLIADKFCDYWRARPGAAGRKTDWSATWRNWCRSEAERRGPGNRSAPAARSGAAWMAPMFGDLTPGDGTGAPVVDAQAEEIFG